MLLGRLRVRQKLVLLVLPLLVIAVVGAVPLVAGRVLAAERSGDAAGLVQRAARISELIQELQQERLASIGYLTGDVDRDRVVTRTARVQELASQVGRDYGTGDNELSVVLDGVSSTAGLGGLRSRVLAKSAPGLEVYRGFSDVTNGLIGVLRLTEQADLQTEAGRQQVALDSIIRHDEATAAEGSALFIEPGRQITARVIGLVSRGLALEDRSEDMFKVLAQARAVELYEQVKDGQSSTRLNNYLGGLVGNASSTIRATVASDLLPQVESLTSLSRLVETQVANQAVTEANRSARTDRWLAGLGLGIALLLLIGATVLSVLITRSIARPLRRLTASADEVADVAQQELVRVADTDDPEAAVPQLRPVQVGTSDELGELAHAFNRVQQVASSLVERQLVSRQNVATMFGNVGRRTQNLVGRQLAMIDSLERNEQDPALLDRLYRLDHVSTRLRRNANSLVVLSGATDQQITGEPLTVADTIRSALGEIEGFQRVRLEDVDGALLTPHVTPDVILLLAELLENGTSFSPPHTEVEVDARSTSDGGVVVRIVDHGLGMTTDQLDAENGRLVSRERLDLAPTDVLGLFVAGRLARRHGIEVVLGPTPGTGVTAEVRIPRRHVVRSDAAAPVVVEPVPSVVPSSSPASAPSSSPSSSSSSSSAEDGSGGGWWDAVEAASPSGAPVDRAVAPVAPDDRAAPVAPVAPRAVRAEPDEQVAPLFRPRRSGPASSDPIPPADPVRAGGSSAPAQPVAESPAPAEPIASAPAEVVADSSAPADRVAAAPAEPVPDSSASAEPAAAAPAEVVADSSAPAEPVAAAAPVEPVAENGAVTAPAVATRPAANGVTGHLANGAGVAGAGEGIVGRRRPGASLAAELAAAQSAPAVPVGAEKSDVEKSGVEKSGVEKSGVEKSGVEKSGAEKSGAEKSGAENAGVDMASVETASVETASVETAGVEKAGAEKAGAEKAGVAAGGAVEAVRPKGAAGMVRRVRGAQHPDTGAPRVEPQPLPPPSADDAREEIEAFEDGVRRALRETGADGGEGFIVDAEAAGLAPWTAIDPDDPDGAQQTRELVREFEDGVRRALARFDEVAARPAPPAPLFERPVPNGAIPAPRRAQDSPPPAATVEPTPAPAPVSAAGPTAGPESAAAPTVGPTAETAAETAGTTAQTTAETSADPTPDPIPEFGSSGRDEGVPLIPRRLDAGRAVPEPMTVRPDPRPLERRRPLIARRTPSSRVNEASPNGSAGTASDAGKLDAAGDGLVQRVPGAQMPAGARAARPDDPATAPADATGQDATGHDATGHDAVQGSTEHGVDQGAAEPDTVGPGTVRPGTVGQGTVGQGTVEPGAAEQHAAAAKSLVEEFEAGVQRALQLGDARSAAGTAETDEEDAR